MWLPIVYFEKIRVFKAGFYALNTLAWDNEAWQGTCFVGLIKKKEGETFLF
jgi:xanthine dehydrogenase molybdopterin-binding subunit B